MASTYTSLGIEKMATGENAGTWGTKTNTNLDIIQASVASYVEKSIAGGAQTTTLAILDGDATESTSIARSAIIKLTGAITGNQIVTVPDSLEKTFVVVNGTTGAYTVQFKTVSGSGITFATTDKGSKFLFADATNINEIISSSIPADNITTGDAASTFATSAGAVLIDSQASTATVDGHTGVTIQSTGSGDITLDSFADIVLDADGGDVFFKDAGTTFGSATNSSGNLIIKSGTTTALTFSGANATLAGDLTISGDDLTMGTNTSGAALIGDGTNFNPVVISGDVSIGTTGTAAIGSGVIVNADVNASAAIAISKTALVAGTGITLSTDTLNLDAAQTGITSLLATDIKIGEDNETKIDFETINEIHLYAANAEQVYVADGIFGPQTDSDVDLGTTGVRWKDTFVDTINVTTTVVAGTTIASGTDIYVGGSNNELRFYEGVNYVGFEAPALSADKIWVLPAADGSSGQQLTTNGSGTLSWAAAEVGSVAADDITAGDAAVSIATSSGNVVVDSNAGLVSVDGHTGVTLASSSSGDITLDSVADIIVDAAGGNVEFKDAGTTQLTLDMDGTAGAQVIQLRVDTDDLIFKQYDGTTVLTLDDDTTVKVAAALTVGGASTTEGLVTANAKIDLNGTELILDADADTSITADTDDTIDIRVAGADDFQITANTFTILSGSTIAIAAGGGFTNAGTMSPDITSTGKALIMGF
jgi:hypothetical protein